MQVFIVSGSSDFGSFIESVHISAERAKAAASALEAETGREAIISGRNLAVGLELTHGRRAHVVELTPANIKAALDSANQHGHQNTGVGPDAVRFVEFGQ